MTGIVVAALVIAVPAVAFTLWPIMRGSRARTMLPLPADPRERLLEDKHRILGALRELSFEHDAGHVSDDDYADLRARYEGEAAAVLGELDRLMPVEAPAPRASPALRGSPAPRGSEVQAPAARRSAWRHPLTIGAGALALAGLLQRGACRGPRHSLAHPRCAALPGLLPETDPDGTVSAQPFTLGAAAWVAPPGLLEAGP